MLRTADSLRLIEDKEEQTDGSHLLYPLGVPANIAFIKI